MPKFILDFQQPRIQAANGTSELIIGKSLGHSPGSKATSVYARLGIDPVRESVEAAVLKMTEAGSSPEEKGDSQTKHES